MSDALLNRILRWNRLEPHESDLIRGIRADLKKVDRGNVLSGDIRPGSALVMLDCWGARLKDTSNGRRVITEFLLPGEVLEMDEFTQRTAMTMALSRGVAAIVGPDELAALRASPKIDDALRWLAAVRRSISNEWLVNVGSRKAHQRLAHLLCELSVRANAAGMLHDDVAQMPLTQVDLAAALSMSNVHLNIALQRLRNEGVVEIRDKHLQIRDRDLLDRIASFDDGYLLQWPTRLPERRNFLATLPAAKERRRMQFGAL